MTFTTESALNIPLSEAQGQTLVARWLEDAGLPPDAFPLDLEDAGAVLAAGGYAVDGQELQRLAGMGQVPAVMQWDAKDLICAAGCLESRRQWKLTPCPHDIKKTREIINLEANIAAGPEAVAAMRKQLSKLDLRLCLLLIVESESRPMREKLLAIAQAILLADYEVPL